MVNSRLRSSAVDDQAPHRDLSCQNRTKRIFATKAALTNEIIAVEPARSRFGSADSWVIRRVGRQFLPWGIKSSARLQARLLIHRFDLDPGFRNVS
jgi:hypothetical protein